MTSTNEISNEINTDEISTDEISSTATGSGANTASPFRIRLAVVDEQRLVAEALSALLGQNGIEVVAVASTWAELSHHPNMPADVAVLDAHLDDGIPVSSKVIALTSIGVATVVTSRHTDAASISIAMRSGALAFIAKGDSVEELIAGVRSAARGIPYLSAHRTLEVEHSNALPDPGLGRQEERALVLYASGRSIREVAIDMQTTDETVKSYIKRGRRKFLTIGIDIGTRVLLRGHAARVGWVNQQ